ncbi:hypothetical protein GCM10029992_52500 [Glycomyces albus]
MSSPTVPLRPASRPRARSWGELELRGGFEHAFASLRMHMVSAVERLGSGGDRDARQFGDVGQRGGAGAA